MAPQEMDNATESSRALAAHLAASDHQFATPSLTLGAPTSFSFLNDPRHVSFVLARYKFVAKMLDGLGSVLEVGCGDGIGMPLVAQTVSKLHCVDWEKRQVESVEERWGTHFENVSFQTADITKASMPQKFDAVYSVDVIEHIDPEAEPDFWRNTVASLKPNGVCLVGTPNKTAEHLAGPESKLAHINLHTHASLREAAKRHFTNVFMFGMNDEVLHTGYPPMAHYLWALCVSPI